jgi:Reverse transcriptase (RNA-dependent DNA polymerase)
MMCRLVLYCLMNYDSRIIDMETAFLYGDLEERIFMKIPQGYREVIGDDKENDVLELQKSLYGLVQAARQWWKTLTTFLTEELGFVKSDVDPCMLVREDNNGTVYFALYVDDILMIGNTSAIERTVEEIQEKFNIKDLG